MKPITMHDGTGYIVAAYSLAAVVLAAWFAMIVRRLRLTRRLVSREEGEDARS